MSTLPRVNLLPLRVCAALLLLGCGRPASDESPSYRCAECNVILISLDTLRADRLGAYGYTRDTSPALDAFAAEGVVFEDFVHNGGATLPSHMTLMTSLYPLTHGVAPGNERGLEPERVTLAEQLQGAGYTTAAFTDGGWMLEKYFGQGFDSFDDNWGRLEKILPKVYRWLDEHGKEKFFLFIHTYDIHSEWGRLPYRCPQDYHLRYTSYEGDFDGCLDGKCATELLLHIDTEVRTGRAKTSDWLGAAELTFISDLYDGCVRYVDDKMQELFDDLRERGLYDKSLIVVTSDHGEELGEHGRFFHDHDRAYEEMIKIPLLVRFPSGAIRNKRVPHLATLADVMPTILDVVDIPVSEEAQGVSLVPTVLGDQPVRAEAHLLEGLRTPRWKFMSQGNQLFDLSRDPGEATNLSSQEKSMAGKLARRWSSLRDRDRELSTRRAPAASGTGTPMKLSPEERERLRALGYAD